MLSKRHGATGHHGVSCVHHLRSNDPPLNPMECNFYGLSLKESYVANPILNPRFVIILSALAGRYTKAVLSKLPY